MVRRAAWAVCTSCSKQLRKEGGRKCDLLLFSLNCRYPFSVVCYPCQLPVVRSRCLQSFEQSIQHLPNVNNPSQEGPEVLIRYQLEIARQLNVAFEFGYRSEGVLNEASKLMRTRMRATLNDVRRDRHSCSRELISERGTSNPAHSRSNAVSFDRELMSLLPNTKFSEICHAESFMGKDPLSPSFVGEQQRDRAPGQARSGARRSQKCRIG